MAPIDVLIVGGGPTGMVAAYWLGRGGVNVTVVERTPGNLAHGQGIDVEGKARKIVERMGVLEEMRSKGTGEEGFSMLDDNGKAVASLGQKNLSITSDIEIMRGDLCTILAKAADSLPNVTLKYGRTVTGLEQTPDIVSVTFDDGSKVEFHAVLAADGLRSRTRDMVFDKSITADAYKTWDNFCAFFDLEYDPEDWPNSRYQQCGQARTCFIRPVNKQKSSGYLTVRLQEERLKKAQKGGREAQKQALKEIFEGVGGIVPRAIEQMMASENFYFEQLGQVKMSTWSQGRCAVIGDAGYAPSPLTGQGTQLGICGAYVLAAELTADPEHPQAAFAAYEKKFRPFVDKAQTVPLGGLAPKLASPATSLGVWANRTAFKIFAMTGFWKRFEGKEKSSADLPTYPHFDEMTPL